MCISWMFELYFGQHEFYCSPTFIYNNTSSSQPSQSDSLGSWTWIINKSNITHLWVEFHLRNCILIPAPGLILRWGLFLFREMDVYACQGELRERDLHFGVCGVLSSSEWRLKISANPYLSTHSKQLFKRELWKCLWWLVTDESLQNVDYFLQAMGMFLQIHVQTDYFTQGRKPSQSHSSKRHICHWIFFPAIWTKDFIFLSSFSMH